MEITASGGAAQDAEPARGSHRRRVELMSVLLMTLAGGISTWCGYQSALWGSVQARSYARGAALRVESARQSGIASRQVMVDVALFTSWMEAESENRPALQKFYRQRFRPELSRAFEAWLKTDPLEDPAAPSSPFAMPQYVLAANEEAARLESEASEQGRQGDAANFNSDRYVMPTVTLALVLIFSGLAQQFRVSFVQLGMLAAAAALFIIAVSDAVALPRAHLSP